MSLVLRSLSWALLLGCAGPLLKGEPDGQSAETPEGLKNFSGQVSETAGERAWFGVGGTPVTLELQRHLRLNSGLLVQQVVPGSPAYHLGISPDDVLLSVASSPVTKQEDLRDLLKAHQPGQSVPVQWIHRGKVNQKTATLWKREPCNPSWSLSTPWSLARQGCSPRPLRQTPRSKAVHLATTKADQNCGAKQWPQSPCQALKDGLVVVRSQEGEVHVHCQGQKRQLVIQNGNGKVLFSGPFTTKEDQQKLPQELQARIAILGL